MNDLIGRIESLRQVIADNDPNEPIADNGMTVWHGVQHEAAYLLPRLSDLIAQAERANVLEAVLRRMECECDSFHGHTCARCTALEQTGADHG